MKEVYLDNNATTPLAPEVKEVMDPYFKDSYGNPSSLHGKGIEAERAVKKSRRILAEALGVKEYEVYFTSGATESDNWALKGLVYANSGRGKHVVTSKVEHDAALESAKFLEKEGFEVTYLNVDEYGRLTPEEVADAVRNDTILVAIMHVNNEIGTIYPINEIADAVKKKNPHAITFSDGVQALGKLKLDLTGVDAYAVNAHKLHGPKGVGALMVRGGINIKPLIHGGGQEKGLRSGTENVPAIAGFGKAVELAYNNIEETQNKLNDIWPHLANLDKNLDKNLAKYKNLANSDTDLANSDTYLAKYLARYKNLAIQDVRVNSPIDAIPTTINISFIGIPSEVLLHSLEERGIYASAGSACSTNKDTTSHVLKALDVPQEVKDSSLRFGLSRYTTEEDIEYTVDTLKEVVPKLREVTNR